MSSMRLPPASVTLTARFLLLCSFLSGIAGVLTLVGPYPGADKVFGGLSLAMAAALFFVSQRLSVADRTSWFVAIGLLALLTAVGLAGRSWFLILPAGALACLLSSSARAFFAAPENDAAVAE
jgi:hypothetical protein